MDKVRQALRGNSALRDERVVQLIDWQKGRKWPLYGEVVMAAMRAPYPLWSANLDRDEIMEFYRQPVFPKGQWQGAQVDGQMAITCGSRRR